MNTELMCFTEGAHTYLRFVYEFEYKQIKLQVRVLHTALTLCLTKEQVLKVIAFLTYFKDKLED